MTMLALLALLCPSPPDTLYAVEVFGNRSVPAAAVREAIGLREGDPVPDSTGPIRNRVAALAGVAEVDIAAVCCGETGGTILYVGIRESGTPPVAWRPSPAGSARLPAEIVAAGDRFESALQSAVRRGVTEEDGSRGYSLARDSAVRSVQAEFIAIAARSTALLADVLQQSRDAAHRALAAQIVAYGPSRAQAARLLLHAADDPDDEVRNNATRALALLAQWANEHPEAGLAIPAEPFIPQLNSVSWTDRNKAVFLLVPLTASRAPAVLREISRQALPALIEMARWRSAGHALGPFLLLGRLAGLDDGAAFQAWQSGQRETVIARAQERSGH